MPTAYSHLSGNDVDTSSEAWRHECECRWLLTAKPTRTEKHMYLYGIEDRSKLFAYNERNELVLRSNFRALQVGRPMMNVRSLEAADRILADAKRIYDLTNAK